MVLRPLHTSCPLPPPTPQRPLEPGTQVGALCPQGSDGAVLRACKVLCAAVLRYKHLCEGACKGAPLSRVTSTTVLMGRSNGHASSGRNPTLNKMRQVMFWT